MNGKRVEFARAREGNHTSSNEVYQPESTKLDGQRVRVSPTLVGKEIRSNKGPCAADFRSTSTVCCGDLSRVPLFSSSKKGKIYSVLASPSEVLSLLSKHLSYNEALRDSEAEGFQSNLHGRGIQRRGKKVGPWLLSFVPRLPR